MALRNYHDSRSVGGAVREEEEEDNEPEPPRQEEKDEDEDEDVEEEEEKPKKRLRNAKKSNLKTNSAKKNRAVKTNSETKNTPKVAQKSNTIRVPKTTVTVKPKNTKTINQGSNQNRINNNFSSNTRTNTTGNTSTKTSKTNTAVKQNPVRKVSAERRPPERNQVVRNKESSSVGKRNNSANKRAGNVAGKLDESELQDFKKILAKNKVERVKTEKEKVEYLKNVISDYFRYKEIDKFFRKMIESNPIFKGVSSKIMKNVKNTKEFSLRKLNAINALVASGDKNAFYNFMKIKEKDKVNRNYFEIMKKSFNSLVKGGPLKNMAEIEISNYCRIVLDFPEFSIQVSKDLLKYCE